MRPTVPAREAGCGRRCYRPLRGLATVGHERLLLDAASDVLDHVSGAWRSFSAGMPRTETPPPARTRSHPSPAAVPRDRTPDPLAVAQVRKAVSQVRKAVSQVRKAVSQMRKPVSQVRKVVSQVRKAVSQVRKAVSQVRKAVSQVRKVVSQVRKAVSQVRKAVSQMRKVVSQLRKPVSQVRRAVSQMREAVAQVRPSRHRMLLSFRKMRTSLRRVRTSPCTSRRQPTSAARASCPLKAPGSPEPLHPARRGTTRGHGGPSAASARFSRPRRRLRRTPLTSSAAQRDVPRRSGTARGPPAGRRPAALVAQG
jgi:phage shock protein A